MAGYAPVTGRWASELCEHAAWEKKTIKILHVWFVPKQIAWSREGTGLPSETLEGPLRRFTEFERGEVKFFFPNLLLHELLWKNNKTPKLSMQEFIKGRNDFVPTIMTNGIS